LARAIESKYNVSATAIRYLYRRNRKGITAKLDDDLLKYYCNEDTFLMQVCYLSSVAVSGAENISFGEP
jgi:transcription factor CP2-like protein